MGRLGFGYDRCGNGTWVLGVGLGGWIGYVGCIDGTMPVCRIT